MKKIILIIGIGIIIFSCKSDKKESEEVLAQEEVENTQDCLERFDNKYDELLTREELISVYPFNNEDVKVDVSNRSYGHHTITWPSNRPNMNMKVAGREMNLPDENFLSVAVLNFYSQNLTPNDLIKRFDRGYKNLTENELEEINKNLADLPEENKQINQELMDARSKMDYAHVENIGQSAWYKWNENYGGELAVLLGRAKFDIRVKISKDSIENLDLSKKIAMIIVEKCR